MARRNERIGYTYCTPGWAGEDPRWRILLRQTEQNPASAFAAVRLIANRRETTESCLKRFADIMSAFENGRAGHDRPQWAQTGRRSNARPADHPKRTKAEGAKRQILSTSLASRTFNACGTWASR
jgi:hypothetical protein